jgi:hypothetical protein
MKQQRPLKLVLTALAIIGTIALLIMLSIAMYHYVLHTTAYTANFLPGILIPFNIIFLVTVLLGVFAYLLPGKHEEHV